MASFLSRPTAEKPKRKKPVKHEASFQTLFSRGFKELSSAYHKISDQSSDSKPFDAFGQHNGIMYAMELKTHTKKTAFPFSKIEDHQYEMLESFSRNGAYGVIIIEIKNELDHFIVFEEINELIRIKNTAGRKSIPYKEIKEMKTMEFGKTVSKNLKCVKMVKMIKHAEKTTIPKIH